MKKAKKLLSFFCTIGLVACSAFAFTACLDNGDDSEPKYTEGMLFFLSEDKTYYTCGGMGKATDTDVIIPPVFYDKPVVGINRDAFKFCSSLTSVIIPDSVTFIETDAFVNCGNLTSITIPDSVKVIRANAFTGCDKLVQTENGVQYVDKWVIGCDAQVNQVILRDNTKGIAESSFSDCSSLTSVTVPESVISIGNSAFNMCSSLTSVTVPQSVTYIGDSAFSNCSSLKSLTIQNSATSIGVFAFVFTGLTSVTIPASVTSVAESAFFGCSDLKDVNFEGTKAQWNGIVVKDTEVVWWEPTAAINYTVHCTDGDIEKP